jgi:uncharacterized repeat protein (TIGR03943 family)
MTKLFSRWLPCATLAAWSVILLHFADKPSGAFWDWVARTTHLFSGRIDSFLVGSNTLNSSLGHLSRLHEGAVNSTALMPSYCRAYVLIAGILLGIMALAFALFPADAECCTTAACSHPLSRARGGRWLTFLILLVPISAASFFSQDSFGKSTMMNRGVVTDASSLPQLGKVSSAPLDLPLPTQSGAPASATPAPAGAAQQPSGAQPATAQNDYLERTPEGYIVAEVLDLLYAAQDNVLRKDFEGKTVQLIGQFMPDTTNNPNGNRFKAVRMFMTCCAADARPVAALVQGNQAPNIPEMSWVKIIGTATFPVEKGRRTAILQATKVEKTEPPEETMLY